MNPNNCKPANAQLWAEPNARCKVVHLPLLKVTKHQLTIAQLTSIAASAFFTFSSQSRNHFVHFEAVNHQHLYQI